jgi:hypothetical protein
VPSSKDIRLGDGGLGMAAFFALEAPFDDFFELPCSLISDSSVPLLRFPRTEERCARCINEMDC